VLPTAPTRLDSPFSSIPNCWPRPPDIGFVAAYARTLMTHRVYKMSFASVYPHYVAKAEKKGRTRAEVDEIIRWLTGYSEEQMAEVIADKTDFENFFGRAPKLNPSRDQIKGVICGIRIEEIEDPLMKEIRYLDKLIDELAKGKKMEKILR
jgi:hypothetical protein